MDPQVEYATSQKDAGMENVWTTAQGPKDVKLNVPRELESTPEEAMDKRTYQAPLNESQQIKRQMAKNPRAAPLPTRDPSPRRVGKYDGSEVTNIGALKEGR